MKLKDLHKIIKVEANEDKYNVWVISNSFTLLYKDLKDPQLLNDVELDDLEVEKIYVYSNGKIQIFIKEEGE